MIKTDLINGDLCSSPSGEYIYVACVFSVAVIRTSDNTVVDMIEVGTSPRLVCVTPNGEYLYVVCADVHGIDIVRTDDSQVVATIDDLGYVFTDICSDVSGDYVYLTSKYGGVVILGKSMP